jgi:hypothetical protein
MQHEVIASAPSAPSQVVVHAFLSAAPVSSIAVCRSADVVSVMVRIILASVMISI